MYIVHETVHYIESQEKQTEKRKMKHDFILFCFFTFEQLCLKQFDNILIYWSTFCDGIPQLSHEMIKQLGRCCWITLSLCPPPPPLFSLSISTSLHLYLSLCLSLFLSAKSWLPFLWPVINDNFKEINFNI